MEDYCPDCGASIYPDDYLYMELASCCKVCYDDFKFGEEDDQDEEP